MSWRDSLLVAFIGQLVIKCLIESISVVVSSECHHSNSQAMCDPGSEGELAIEGELQESRL